MSRFNNLSAMTRLRSQALACCSALAIVGGAAPAFAQETPAGASTEPEAIVVTGIRSSLRSAAGIKKNSLAIVDAISSEDLGKFPDTNVAESLQRIGVTRSLALLRRGSRPVVRLVCGHVFDGGALRSQ